MPRVKRRIDWTLAAPLAAFHAAPFAALWTGVQMRDLLVALALHVFRGLCITVGYHRLFSHRSFRAAPALRAVLAFGGTAAFQGGPLSWVAKHRHHHRHSDDDLDLHSPRHGFLWSHLLWFLGPLDFDRSVPDLEAMPEVAVFDRFWWAPGAILAAACLALGGASCLVVGFFWSTVFTMHATFSVNSLAHMWGSRPHATGDTSRNNWALALPTFGESWHNNHHRHQSRARFGERWWQIDLGWWTIRALAVAGLAGIRSAPMPARAAEPVDDPVQQA